MANNVQKSPGLYISETDLTFSVESVGNSFLGVVGETMKGPAFEVRNSRDFNEHKLRLGSTNPEKFKGTQIPKYEEAYIAKSFLTQSNQLYTVRVLGLSGYDAGNAFNIVTLGGCDVTTVNTTPTNTTIDFTLSGGTFYVSGSSTQLIDQIASDTGVAKTKFDAAFNTFFTASGVAPYESEDVLYWGFVDDVDGILTAESLSGSTVDAYELPATTSSDDRDDYVLQKECPYVSNNDNYAGASFALWVDSSNLESGATGGTINLRTFAVTCDPKADFHNMPVATLRSNGSYVGETMRFNVSGSSDLVLNDTTAVEIDANAEFELSGVTRTGTAFTYTVSLDSTKKSFISTVLGTDPLKTDTNVFVDEVYTNALKKAIASGDIKGLNGTIKPVVDHNHYKTSFKTPVTPYIVSELVGGEAKRLFRFVSISDGASANSEIKVSISNVDLSKKTFDVLVRAFGDTDNKPAILERYFNCSMDSTSDNFIGRLIGTSDGEFSLVSEYVMIEMADNAPSTVVPAGFEGYTFRDLGNDGSTDNTFKAIAMPYNTTYVANVDKVRKTYLGFSSKYGLDSSLFKYKGIDGDVSSYDTGVVFTGSTKGFHFDSGASATAFEVGSSVFNVDGVALSGNTYNDVRTRKFTVAFAGGFDGWDIYRESRTNTDDYKIGQTAFTNAGFDTYFDAELNETIGVSDYYAYYKAIKQFSNPEEYRINILATPGIDLVNNTLLVNEVIEMVEEERGDCIYLPTLPDIKLLSNTDAANKDNWYYPEDIVNLLEATSIDSSYLAVFYPWIQYLDTENTSNIFIPPTAEVIKNFALTDNIAFPWYATAGYSRGLVNTRMARKIKLNQDSRDTLYEGRINPLMTFNDRGVVIWGNRNLQEADTALNRINIRRLLLEAQRLVSQVGRRLLFDPNDANIRNDFLREVNPILESIRAQRGLYDFRVSLDSTLEDLDSQTLRGKIFLKPIRTVEFIELEYVVTPISQSFEGL